MDRVEHFLSHILVVSLEIFGEVRHGVIGDFDLGLKSELSQYFTDLHKVLLFSLLVKGQRNLLRVGHVHVDAVLFKELSELFGVAVGNSDGVKKQRMLF